MIKQFMLLVIIIFFIGCKKEKQSGSAVPITVACQDKQIPGEYFPAFPKTWWNYKNQNNASVKYEISSDYENCEGGCRPVFLNLNKCIQGENLIHSYYCGLGAMCGGSSPIYSLKIDSVFHCLVSFSTLKSTPSGQFPIYRRVTVKTDTSMTVSNIYYTNVILVKEFDTTNVNHRYIDYFAKNVGLIKRDSVNANDTTELISILLLENYFIGK